MAPVSAVMTTSEAEPASPLLPAETTISVFDFDLTVAAIESRVTDARSVAPPSSDAPLIVTIEPRTPLFGSTLVISPSAS